MESLLRKRLVLEFYYLSLFIKKLFRIWCLCQKIKKISALSQLLKVNKCPGNQIIQSPYKRGWIICTPQRSKVRALLIVLHGFAFRRSNSMWRWASDARNEREALQRVPPPRPSPWQKIKTSAVYLCLFSYNHRGLRDDIATLQSTRIITTLFPVFITFNLIKFEALCAIRL